MHGYLSAWHVHCQKETKRGGEKTNITLVSFHSPPPSPKSRNCINFLQESEHGHINKMFHFLLLPKDGARVGGSVGKDGENGGRHKDGMLKCVSRDIVIIEIVATRTTYYYILYTQIRNEKNMNMNI